MQLMLAFPLGIILEAVSFSRSDHVLRSQLSGTARPAATPLRIMVVNCQVIRPATRNIRRESLSPLCPDTSLTNTPDLPPSKFLPAAPLMPTSRVTSDLSTPRMRLIVS